MQQLEEVFIEYGFKSSGKGIEWRQWLFKEAEGTGAVCLCSCVCFWLLYMLWLLAGLMG